MPEFNGFREWLHTFELYRGKRSGDDLDDQSRVVGLFKVWCLPLFLLHIHVSNELPRTVRGEAVGKRVVVTWIEINLGAGRTVVAARVLRGSVSAFTRIRTDFEPRAKPSYYG